MGTDVVVDVVDQPVIMVNRERAPEKIPIIAAIPGDIWISMVQKRPSLARQQNNIGRDSILAAKASPIHR